MQTNLKPYCEFSEAETKIYQKIYDDIKNASIPNVINFINKNSEKRYGQLKGEHFENICKYILKKYGAYELIKSYAHIDLNGCYDFDEKYYDSDNTRYIARDIIIENIKDLDSLDMSDLYSVNFKIL